MGKLTGQTIADSYDQLLIVDHADGISSSLQAVESADTGGSASALQISTVAAAIDNPTTSSASQGGKLTLFSDDGAALGDTHRLGVIEFSAAEDSSSTITIGARIEAIADAAWSASENGADMVFYTTDGNASQSEVLRLTADNFVGIGADAPTTLLDIKGADVVTSGSQGAQLYIQDTADYNAAQVCGLQFRQIWHSDGSITSTSGIYGARESTSSGQYGGSLHFQTRVHGGDLADKMVIDSAGRVGIGVTSADTTTLLTVGTTSASDANGILINRGTRPTISGSQAAISCVANGDTGGSGEAMYLQGAEFHFMDDDESTKFMIIKSTGEIGINATPADAMIHLNNDITGSNSIYIDHDSDGNGIYIENTNRSSGGGYGVFSSYGVTTDNNRGALYGLVTVGQGYAGHFKNTSSASSSNYVVGIEATHTAYKHWTLYVNNLGTDSLGATVNQGAILASAACVSSATEGVVQASGTNGSFVGSVFQSNLHMNSNGAGFLYRGHSDSNNDGDGIDREFYVSVGGVVAGESSFSTGADYAEYFETKDGESIAVGTTVKLDGEKVVPCEDGDPPIGVIRPKVGASSSIGNTAHSKWNKKYLRDDYGGYLLEECTTTEWVEVTKDDQGDDREDTIFYYSDKIPNDIVVPDNAVVKTHHSITGKKITRKILNPDFDKNKDYVAREDRGEWVVIGLLGQVPVTKGQPVSSSWIKMKDVSDTVEMYFVK